SVAGRVCGTPYQGFYAASKHALNALSEAMHWEVGTYGIRVACIEPGFFSTDIFANSQLGVADDTSTYASDRAWVDEFFLKSGEAAGGDPAVVAEAIVKIAADPAPPLHTLVGDDAFVF